MPEEDAGTDDPLVHELFRDYAGRLELGESPRLADYEQRLPTAPQRRELRGLVRTLEAVDRQLPPWIGPDALVADRYRILRQLGEGGMARVWLARDQKNDRDVALKVLRLSGPHELTAALLRRERKALARLHHPHIVTFLDADRWRDSFYLVMDFVDGTSMKSVVESLRQRRAADPAWRRDSRALAAAIDRPRPSGRQDLLAGRSHGAAAAAVVAACASALEHAHAHNVVHRDLKPGNVLLLGGGNPVLLDFGLAALRDASKHPLSTELFGTPHYVAPEQARAGRMGSDFRTDLYQLGAMLHELLTLQQPWADAPTAGVVEAIADGQLPRARSLDPAIAFELDCICARAVVNRPEDRYQSATELRVDLERYLGRRELPDAARAGAPIGLRCRYFARRYALLLVAVAVAATAVTVALLI